MRALSTNNLLFYHGTSRTAALAILGYGARNSLLDEIGAFSLGREILQSLLDHARLSHEDLPRLHFAFVGRPGAEYSSLWLPALRQLDGGERSHFEYGHFCATLNIANAYRYTVGNPYRSEFIRVLAESLKLLEDLCDQIPQKLTREYPAVASAIESPSPPVVLELTGIARERLLNGKGGQNIEGELQAFLDIQQYPGVNAPADFRIRDVIPSDIVAVHDLSDWLPEDVGDSSWRPKKNDIAAARRSTQDWLTKARAV
jgi:hypothetical protein